MSIAVVAFAVVGCGGSSGDSGGGSTDGPTTGKAAFIAQADRICTDGGKEFEKKLSAYLEKEKIKEIGAPGEPRAETESHAIAMVETVGLPVFRKQVEEIKALEPPSEVSDEAARFVEAVEEAIEAGERNPLQMYATQSKQFAKSDRIAQQIGFKVCGGH